MNVLSSVRSAAVVTRRVIFLVLTLGATVAGVWARQANGGVDQIRTIDVVASRFAFEPPIISVVLGDRIRLRLRSTDGTHGIAIKAFRVKALIPKEGAEVTVDFVASRAGEFELTCAEYCGTGHSAMKGRLIVLPRDR